MNKAELVELASTKTDMSKKDLNEAFTVFTSCITETVAAGDKVVLVGFGSFEARDRKAREGRNPKTGETMEIPATVVPAFSAGKQFRAAVSRQ